MFATVLRLPGAAAGAVLTAASEEKSLGPAESSLSVMCEITGGRCVAVTGMRALLQNMVRAAALQRERESGPGGLTREVETPLPSNKPLPCDQLMPFQLNTLPCLAGVVSTRPARSYAHATD